MIPKKKLIEVALPLEAINAASAREKSIRHGHPSTLHLWWARRPLAAARAVIFAQLVDDPSAHPERFPTEEAQERERQRLFRLIEELVKWENTTNETVLKQAREEIWQSWRLTCAESRDHPHAAELFDPEKLPAFHDPFAGGGALPLEAQRLGLESYASDLNPVAVLINKAMIEIPPKFAGRPPVNPEARRGTAHSGSWKGAAGLAEDVRYYGQWMRDEAEKRIGHLYPKIEITAEMAKERPDLKPLVGRKLTVIAWLWARTVKSPNPAFAHVDVPLASTFMLSTKAGKEAYVEPVIEGDGYRFTVKVGKPKNAEAAKRGTKSGSSGSSFLCLMSGTPMPFEYLRPEAKAGRMGARLMTTVAEGERGRVYLSPTPEMEAIAMSAKPKDVPETDLPAKALGFRVQEYGMTKWRDLFTPRQLVALTTFSDLLQEARERVKADYLGMRASRPRTVWHRTHLPHFEAGQTPQHITFRLYDSLPSSLLASWSQELREIASDAERDRQRRQRIEEALDRGISACWLRRPEIARLVADALTHFADTRYRLHAWVVMPNHVHVLITPLHGNSLSSILHSWKSFTAKKANTLLQREGAFWQEDYFDRFIRNAEHYERVVTYIHENPVKAGLCKAAEEWDWSNAGDGASRAGRPRAQDEIPLAEGGTGAQAYADAVGGYLALAVDRMANTLCTIARWTPERQQTVTVFARQAIPMTWDFPDVNPFASAAGDYAVSVDGVIKGIPCTTEPSGFARQADASHQDTSRDKLVSTDPPYYDNIGYADLSDFFYVWLRRSLKPVFSDLFATLAVPKAEELVATPYRHGSKEKAEAFFLDGMTKAMHHLAEQVHPAFPVTIYYAFKQSENLGTRASGPREGGENLGTRASGPREGGTPPFPGVTNSYFPDSKSWKALKPAPYCPVRNRAKMFSDPTASASSEYPPLGP